MSHSNLHGSAPRKQTLESTTTGNLKAPTFSNPSSRINIPSGSGSRSRTDLSSTSWTSSECTSCPIEPSPVGSCDYPLSAEEHQCLPGCLDPACTENVCDECSDHEECCGDCVEDCDVDCGSDCEISFRYSEPNVKLNESYTFSEDSYELFGDQTAQTFGIGCSLPQLAKDNTMIDSSGLGKILDHTALSTLPKTCMDPSPQTPWASHKQLGLPKATTPSRSCYESVSHRLPDHEVTANRPPPTCATPSLMRSPKSAYGTPDPTDCTSDAHYDHVNLLNEKDDSSRPLHPSLRCQWADLNGKPCGEISSKGEDMHEHLKSIHGIKSEVFCRWAGCSVGVLKPSPHKFASSVERHTWGHSGYRPYKCSACNEGFAAASVREEHYKNIHERRKVYACDVCSHHCTSATNLKRHKDDKHSVEKFQCEFCNRNGKRRLFSRGPNLARHLRKCKSVLAQFPEAAAAGRAKADWLPSGYKKGHHGMDRAKITPPNYLPAQHNA